MSFEFQQELSLCPCKYDALQRPDNTSSSRVGLTSLEKGRSGTKVQNKCQLDTWRYLITLAPGYCPPVHLLTVRCRLAPTVAECSA